MLFYFLNILTTLPTLKVIFSLFFIAILFPSALPVIVSEAITAVVINTTKETSLLSISAKVLATSTPALPLTTPHTSPITSLQIEANLSEFFNNLTE